uniref:ATP synthase F0 subunit 8 n=1 Tax=Stenamma expolitum TaxID=625355 RepID=UPI001FCD8111|nr:ATP synthase F0 subunit 8 [Stenamma expolitum]UNZ99548.1 ATP synthase F0 subunit 8 [Stenamma expolitum]
MPQMKPIWWLFMLPSIIFLMIIIISLMYFLSPPIHIYFINYSSLKYPKWNWKW